MAKSTLGSLLIDLQLNTATIGKQLNDVNKKFDKMGSNIKKAIGALAVGKVFKDLTSAGFNYNSQLETTKNSIGALIVASSKLEDAQGNAISQQELYNRAMSESSDILKELQRINAQTPMGLDETAQIYKSMLPSMRAVGATQSELIELTKNLAIASGTAGLKTNQLLAGVDGLATGTVLANSELGRFLTALGLSNDELKKSTDVVGLLNDKLGKLKGEITMEMQLSTLKENWNATLGALTKSMWTASKDWIEKFSNFLVQFKNAIPDIAIYFKAGLQTIQQYWQWGLAKLNVWFEEFMDTIKTTWDYLTSLGMIDVSVNIDLENAKQQLASAEENLQGFTRNMLDLYDAQEEVKSSGLTVPKTFALIGDSAKKTKKTVEKLTDEQKSLQSTFSSSLNGMENAIVDFARTGKLAFNDFASSVLEDLLSMMIQLQITIPLMKSLTGMMGGVGGGGLLSMFGFAKGGAFTNGVQAFAKGGVVDSPTVFPMAKGIGLMGEAGSEAIMPLTRTANGDLGVKAVGGGAGATVVNIYNESGTQAEVNESTDSNGQKTIDIMIKASVERSIGSGGLDGVLSKNYGITRKGY